MKVTILGASPAIPNPGGACTGLLFEAGDTSLLIDCGVGVVSRLQQHIDYHSLSAIVVTHMHADHALDLVTMRYALKYGAWHERPVIIPVYLPPQGTDALETIASPFAEDESDFFQGEFDISEYDPQAALDIGPFHLTFQPTTHYVPTWAIRVEAEGRVVTFSADTGPATDLSPLAKGSDLFICEAGVSSRQEEPHTWGHLAPDEAGAMARRAHVRVLVLTHVSTGNNTMAMLEAAHLAFGGPTHLAREGEVYVL